MYVEQGGSSVHEIDRPSQSIGARKTKGAQVNNDFRDRRSRVVKLEVSKVTRMFRSDFAKQLVND